MRLKSIRSGRGLGDSIYLESIVRYLIERDGKPLRVASDWPDVFAQHGEMVQVVPFTRTNIDVLAHYAIRKRCNDSTQFEDMCISARIEDQVELRLDWPAPKEGIAADLLADGRPVVLVQLPRSPMGRTDGFGAEILPDCKVIQRVIDQVRGRFLLVQVGAGKPLHKFDGIDIDLANKTTVRDLLDIGAACSGVIGYCSFILAMAEAMHKPSLMVWSRRGLNSRDVYISQIKPQKIIQYPALTNYIIDDCNEFELIGAANAFLQ